MRLRFLVVDDDGDSAQALASVLELRGHDAYIAHGGEDALREAARIRPQAALIDWLMPDTDGVRLASILHGERPDLFLVLVTGYGGREPPEEAQAAGFAAYLRKPASVHALKEIVERVNEHVRTLPARYARLRLVPIEGDAGPNRDDEIRNADAVLRDSARERWERIHASDRLARALVSGRRQAHRLE